MIHKEITDKQWKSIIPHLPKPAKTGRPRADDRTTINGILFVLTVGCRWEELPEKYGSKSTAHLRLQDWQQKGVWKKILSEIIKSAHKQNKINLQKISIDSSSIHNKKGVHSTISLNKSLLFIRVSETKWHYSKSPRNIQTDPWKFGKIYENQRI